MRLYADSSKCSGCNACRVACSLNLFGASNPKMAALIIEPHVPAPGVYEVKVCTQCGDCAKVCPVDCIQQNEKGAYYVVQEECIMCGACVPECPSEAIFSEDDLPAKWKEYTQINRDFSKKWPNISSKKAGPKDADDWKKIADKRQHLSDKPGLGG